MNIHEQINMDLNSIKSVVESLDVIAKLQPSDQNEQTIENLHKLLDQLIATSSANLKKFFPMS
ncbi:MAG: hypothetical protein IT497_00315 [Ottowia sp.]|nr:hypothetical protein [Ottowia sp.]